MKLGSIVYAAALMGSIVGFAGSANANGTLAVQQILDRQFGSGALNLSTDQLADGVDASWSAQTGATATILFEFAGFQFDNILGIYDPTAPEFRLPLFYGHAAQGDDATLKIESLSSGVRFSVTSGGLTESALFGSSVFGFYLRTPEDNAFFSDTALNKDGVDHLRAYGVSSPSFPGVTDSPGGSYLLAWEDLFNGGDKDYDDMVFAVSGYVPTSAATTPVPLPAGILLFGSGLLGLAGFRGRRRVPDSVMGNM